MEEQKEYKQENTKEDIKEVEMATKRRIRGECYEVRERNTSSGKKGTIIKKCTKKKKEKTLREYMLGK